MCKMSETTKIMEEFDEKMKQHPEYTEEQKECLLYGILHRKACEVTPERISQKKRYNKLVCDNPTFVGFSENALRPLINEQDPEIQQKVISIVESAGKEKTMNYGTERKMKAAIARFKDVDAHTPEPKHQNKADFAEECAAFWTKARKHWSEEVIEEVLDKARINTR